MIYQFGDCTLDIARHELRRAGEMINAEPQALKVLYYLLEHRERVVSRDELFEQCWPDSYVSDTSLTTCLRRVRQAIGQMRGGPTLIETVHRRGYRFVAAVRKVGEAGSSAAAVESASPVAPRPWSDEPLALAPERHGSQPTTILIVDDNPTSRELLEQQLQRRGYATRSASNGEAALDQVAAEAPDLILLDVMMPGIDGLDVCRQLKAREETQGIPVIILTALNTREERLAGFAAGASAFLTKPVSRQILIKQIETALSPMPAADNPPVDVHSEPTILPASPRADTPTPAMPPRLEAAAAAPMTERRHLSVLSCTLAQAVSLSLHLDPEDHYELMQTFRTLCLHILAQYDGYVAQQSDDGLLVYFGYPQAHEDDAQRAVRSGLAMVDAIQRGAITDFDIPGGPLAVQVGIGTGIMMMTSNSATDAAPSLGIGSASTLAARLGALAPPDTVVISEATAQLVAGYFDCKVLDDSILPDTAESGLTYEVRGESTLKTRLEVESAYGLTPFVGREAEIALMQERWTYVQEGLGQVILIQGEAGMGKSRLVQLLREQMVDELCVTLECRCSPYRLNTALYPIIDLVQRALQGPSESSPVSRLERLESWLTQYGIDRDETVPILANLLALPLPDGRYAPWSPTPLHQRERTLETLLSLLLVQATTSPLLFVVEDVHWADPSTLDFLHLLTDHVTTASMLVVLTARPGFETPWVQRTEMTRVVLNRLTRVQMESMITQVAAGKMLPAVVMEQLIEKTDGVPLFVEELTRMVLESGDLLEQDTSYRLRGALAEQSIPATLHDSLMARLDQLGAGKELAQWGAVLGREFSHEVLDAVTPYDEPTLHAGLSQLVEAGLMFQRGLYPQSRYRFKHALIQDAAYNALPKRRRQALHRQIAEVLEVQFPEMVESQPELLAHHYTQAGLTEPSIVYWEQAGRQALAHSANQEAMRHLTTGLEALQTLPDNADRQLRELTLQMLLGPVLMALKGQAAPDVQQVYVRAHHLCQQLGDIPQLFPALWGLWRFYNNRPRLTEARQVGEQLINLAEHLHDDGLSMQAHIALGVTLAYRGVFSMASTHLDSALALYDASQHRSLSQMYGGHDPQVYCLANQSHVLWRLGFPDQALAKSNDALALARQLSHPNTLAYALNFAGVIHGLRREIYVVETLMEEQIDLATVHSLALWQATGNIMQGWALSEQGQVDAGVAQLRAGLTAHVATGAELALPYWHCMLIEAYLNQDNVSEGLTVLAETLAIIDRTGESQMEAESYRLKGELLLRQFDPDVSQADDCFRRAIDVARSQQAKSLELRAALSLVRLRRAAGNGGEALALLSSVYRWFAEGFDTIDLLDAKTFLETLEA